ncbi:hypothetical protein OG311_18710 [Streptomyces sp. NBC_01343]|uniref:hypothetical protein n=1 Tax=Streptomyces sp. NBC_01343 TaxID=2903832 RepID=UPI002E0EA044|nr:hypothetical protein OG311_18710 [Streptomyces sp. NBC_01343]
MDRRTLTLMTLCCSLAAACLTGCGGPARDGYAAAGAVAPGPERRAGDNVPPQSPVELRRLAGSLPPASKTGSTPPGTPDPRSPAASARGGSPATPPGTTQPPQPPPAQVPPTPRPPAPDPGTTPPTTPANLTLGPPTRTGAADRWCEKVTVAFTNTGTKPATSGTVTFATHIIGALGIDWATITTTQPLPAPIPGGTTKTRTYTVCVESWRVPLGMHVETRTTTATWT